MGTERRAEEIINKNRGNLLVRDAILKFSSRCDQIPSNPLKCDQKVKIVTKPKNQTFLKVVPAELKSRSSEENQNQPTLEPEPETTTTTSKKPDPNHIGP